MADFVEMKNAVARATEGDIVTRLRKMGVYGPADTTLPIAQEAADEIERLRERLSLLCRYDDQSDIDWCGVCDICVRQKDHA